MEQRYGKGAKAIMEREGWGEQSAAKLFRAIEARLSARGRQLADRTLDEMEAEWQRVKAEE